MPMEGGGAIILSPIGGIPPIGPIGGSIMPGPWTIAGGIMPAPTPTKRLLGRGYWLGGLLLSLREVSVCFLILSSVYLAFLSACLSFFRVLLSMLILKVMMFSL